MITGTRVTIDLETTGVDHAKDHIVQFAALRVENGKETTLSLMINPGVPIPPSATEIHGITDADVENCPKFSKEIAEQIENFLKDAVIIGYNSERFDVPMLRRILECYLPSTCLETADQVDSQQIYFQHEPRDLTAAVKFYCDENFTNAHNALADVKAASKVLEAQIEKYGLPTDISELANTLCADYVDKGRRLKWNSNGEAVIDFGKMKGKSLQYLAKKDPGYLQWIVDKDFPADTQKIVSDALDGKFPVRKK